MKSKNQPSASSRRWQGISRDQPSDHVGVKPLHWSSSGRDRQPDASTPFYTFEAFLCPLFQQIFNFLYWLYWWTLDVPSTRQTQFVYSRDFLLEKSCLFYLAEVSISATFLYLKTNRYLSLCWWLLLKFFEAYFQSSTEWNKYAIYQDDQYQIRISSNQTRGHNEQDYMRSCYEKLPVYSARIFSESEEQRRGEALSRICWLTRRCQKSADK